MNEPARRCFALILAAAAAASAAAQSASRSTPAAPFKLGTFERNGKAFVGLVMRDDAVIDLAAATAALPVGARRARVPADMKELIGRYDTDSALRGLIAEVVALATKEAAPAQRPKFAIDLKDVKTRPPIMYPTTMLNVAVNYREHAQEMAGRLGEAPTGNGAPPPGNALPGTRSAPGIWERAADDTRWNPYMFIKLPSAVIASEEAIQLPPGRTQIDWECELAIVIGREASQVPVASAKEYIFGYTLENDVSDRAGRGDTRHGSDWLIAKSHDTFAPMGPFIVPKDQVPDPQKLTVTFTLNGQMMQNANTSLMIHNVYELVSYASHITTLHPGDVISSGSPAGVGSARNPPIYFKSGDVAVCTYEGIGTLRNPVR
jgi:2-keto-4-pentenoate hydratase/2-oxohepta-3-ene-1,7-dioic acid hydratase in catechol pathway